MSRAVGTVTVWDFLPGEVYDNDSSGEWRRLIAWATISHGDRCGWDSGAWVLDFAGRVVAKPFPELLAMVDRLGIWTSRWVEERVAKDAPTTSLEYLVYRYVYAAATAVAEAMVAWDKETND
jgi:hypothetical protein